jgi:hypothetical protein
MDSMTQKRLGAAIYFRGTFSNGLNDSEACIICIHEELKLAAQPKGSLSEVWHG